MVRRIVVGSVLALLAGSAIAAGGEPSTTFELDCSDSERRIELPASGAIAIHSIATRSAWFEATEQGVLVTASAPAGTTALSIAVPYRYGRHGVLLQPSQRWTIQRTATALGTRQPASVGIRVNCDATATARRQAWLTDLSAITSQLVRRMAEPAAAALLIRIDTLLAAAADPADRALALHAKAQTLLLASRTADAAVAFADAEQAWTTAGDVARARVARVARVEEMQKLSRHDEALALASEVTPAEARADYFAARLRLSRCLTLRYLGRMPEALACFRDGVDTMKHLGETPDQVSALQDMADVSRYLGDLATAQRLGREALEQCTLPDMEVIRGRIQLMLADLALERGDLAGALTGFDGALTEFAAAKAPRWEANALLRTAEMYVALGALEEASEFVSAALTRLSERDAPARVAAAQVVQARIDLQLGRVDRARRGLATAMDTYSRLAMPADLDSARVTSARLLLQIGDRVAAAAIIAARDTDQTLNRDDWHLIQAGLLATQGQCGKSLEILRQFDGKPLSIDRELQRVQTHAECLAAAGQVADAEQNLLTSARRVAALAQQVDSPLLRQVLAGYIAPLRRSAFRIHATANNGSPGEPAAVWQWLHLEEAALATTHSAIAAQEISQFDAEVARELLPVRRPAGAVINADAPRHLLTVLAARNGAGPRPIDVVTETSLAALQQRLGDAVLVTHVDAGRHSRLLWISRDAARLQPTADIQALRAAADVLGAAASDRTTPLSRIAGDAARLTGLLWPPPGDAGTAPARLLVDASSPLATLPWSLLTWPGTDSMLLDTTRVTIARVGAAQDRTPSRSTDVAVYVAGQENNPALATLWNVRSEPGLIESAIRERGGTVSSVAATDREALVAAFSRPRPWLHIAAHGGTLPSRIGYAGIWLESPSAEQAPRFVSWLEILSRGSANELVVLNACQLAETQQASAAGLSFADAVSRAGARDVVAARWQVSDGATTLWVPVFYRAMSEGAGAAESLWQAQRRLHDSRVFRHPFYWASYVHYGRL